MKTYIPQKEVFEEMSDLEKEIVKVIDDICGRYELIPVHIISEELDSRIEYKYTDFLDALEKVCEDYHFDKFECILVDN